MDEDRFPVTGVDLNQVPPIPQKHTVSFLNHYLSRSSHLLNGLSTAAERKLEKVLTQLQQIEAGVCILEAKLNSIPGMTDGITPEPEPEQVPEPPPVVTSQPTKSTPDEPISSPVLTNESPSTDVTDPPEITHIPISKDPRFATYFNMVKMGVPVLAVQQKMILAGVAPELIHKPNAPAPSPTPEDED